MVQETESSVFVPDHVSDVYWNRDDQRVRLAFNLQLTLDSSS